MPLFEDLNTSKPSSTTRDALYAKFHELTADFTDAELAKLVEYAEMTRCGIMACRASKEQ